MATQLRHLAARLVGGTSRRLIGKEFDDVMALGCGVIHEIDPRAGAIALTFDDGPSTHSTGPVLDVLDAERATATFFLLGENARRHPALVREIAARGHDVGCHGHRHLDFHWSSPRHIARDLGDAQSTLEDILGRRVDAARAPFGHFRWDVRRIAARLGISRLVGFSVAPAWNETDPVRVVEYVRARARAGSIILLHDATGLEQVDTGGYNRAVVAALRPMIAAIRAGGLGFSLVR